MKMRNMEMFYHVIYEDNDSEDMSEIESMLCIDLCRQLEDGEINEWEKVRMSKQLLVASMIQYYIVI